MRNRLFAIFAVILNLSVLLLCYYVYENNVLNSRKEKAGTQHAILNAYVNQIESVMGGMTDSAKEYGIDPRISIAAEALAKSRPVGAVDKLRLMEKMKEMMSAKPYIRNIYFVHDPSKSDFSLDPLMEFIGGAARSDWARLFVNTDNSIEVARPLSEEDGKVTRIVVRLPFYSLLKSSMLLIEINNEQLIDQIAGNDAAAIAYRYPSVRNGVFAGAAGERGRDAGVLEFYRYAPTLNGYIVKTAEPAVLYRAERETERFIALLFIFLMFSAFFMAKVLAEYAVKPIQRMTDFVNDLFVKKEPGIFVKRNWTNIQDKLEELLNEHTSMSAAYARFLPLMLERFHYRLLKGQYKDVQEMQAAAAMLNIGYQDRSVGMIMLDRDEATDADVQVLGSVQLLIASAIEQNYFTNSAAYLIEAEHNRLVVLVYGPAPMDEKLFHKQAYHFVKELQSAVSRELRTTFSAGIGSCEMSLQTIGSTYSRLTDLFQYRFNLGKEIILSLNDALAGDRSNELETVYYMDFEKWSNLLNTADEDQLRLAFEELMKGLTGMTNIAFVKEQTLGILYFLMQFINRHDLSRARLGIVEDDIYKTFIHATGLDVIQDKLWDLISRIRGELAGKSRSMDELWISHIKRLIEQNLGNSELSVAMIAEEMNLSPSHVSRTFKKALQVSLVDYINERRIDRSKALLLNTNKKIVEIANECGFLTTHYFNKLFKNNTGVTPSEFKRIHVSGGIEEVTRDGGELS